MPYVFMVDLDERYPPFGIEKIKNEVKRAGIFGSFHHIETLVIAP